MGHHGWHHHDLTAAIGAPQAGSNAAGYVFDAQSTQHVIYLGALIGSDTHAHVQELWWDTHGWHHHDLSAATGAPDAEVGPACYVFNAQGTQHVVYVDLSLEAHVHELWWDTNGWHHHDLSAATGAPSAGYAPLSGYVFDAQGTQHVIYLGSADLHIHELWWDTHGWHHHDLTVATGAPTPAPTVGSGPAGYVFDAQGTQHVVYIGEYPDLHVYELWWG